MTPDSKHLQDDTAQGTSAPSLKSPQPEDARDPAEAVAPQAEFAATMQASGDEDTQLLSDRFQMSRSQLFVLIGMCLFFMYYNYMRLFHSDFWGHVSYGTWIIQHEQLPQQDMYVAHADGMPLVATAWGSQVMLGLIGRLGNDELFSHLYAVVVSASFLLLGLTFRMQGGSSRPAAVTCVCVMLIWLSRHAVIRPELFCPILFLTNRLSACHRRQTTFSGDQRTRHSLTSTPPDSCLSGYFRSVCRLGKSSRLILYWIRDSWRLRRQSRHRSSLGNARRHRHIRRSNSATEDVDPMDCFCWDTFESIRTRASSLHPGISIKSQPCCCRGVVFSQHAVIGRPIHGVLVDTGMCPVSA